MRRIWIWKDMMGYPRISETPVSDRSSVEYVLRDDHEAEIEKLKKALDQAISLGQIEASHLPSDGAIFYVSSNPTHATQSDRPELAAYLKEKG